MTRVLLVEDDDAIALPLAAFLGHEGFEVHRAASAAEADAMLEMRPDVVLLDWRLPDEPGIDVLKRWRAAGRATPVILVTARVDLVDRVVGLELGADDYVTKPFEPRELVARIRARVRHHGAWAVLQLGELSIDEVTRAVRHQGELVELTRMEYALLRFFVANPHQVFGREELLGAVWGYAPHVASRTVDTHVRQLRAKLGADRIETVRGVGYRFSS